MARSACDAPVLRIATAPKELSLRGGQIPRASGHALPDEANSLRREIAPPLGRTPAARYDDIFYKEEHLGAVEKHAATGSFLGVARVLPWKEGSMSHWKT
jgi:hypothetical protein